MKPMNKVCAQLLIENANKPIITQHEILKMTCQSQHQINTYKQEEEYNWW